MSAFPQRDMSPSAREEEGPHEWRCAFTDGRHRCQYPGSISPGQRGGGPWYCNVHFFDRSGPEAIQALEESRSFRAGDPIRARPKPDPLVQEEPGSGG